MIVTLVRHGESTANAARLISNHQPDISLTATGRTQAHDAARALQHRYGSIASLISSPLRRAAETAAFFASEFDIKASQSSLLSEFDLGTLEGASGIDAWDEFYDLWDGWFRVRDRERRLPDGESMAEVASRMERFLASIKTGPVVAVSHGGTIRVVASQLVRNLPTDFLTTHRCPNASFLELELTHNGVFCREHNWALTVGPQ